jgi:hypothetical protein
VEKTVRKTVILTATVITDALLPDYYYGGVANDLHLSLVPLLMTAMGRL